MRLTLLFSLVLLSPQMPAAVSVETGKNTGLKTWTWTHEGISLRLVQRLPDQTRAYALSRGLSAELADRLATACFFGSMFRNDGQLPLDFDLSQWVVVHDGQKSSMFTREYWKPVLEQAGASQSARVGLNWSLMPTRQHFEPGDYNWGMTVYGLPPGSIFDLHLTLTMGGEPLQAVIPQLQCAPEALR